jgi:hypothetical protein
MSQHAYPLPARPRWRTRTCLRFNAYAVKSEGDPKSQKVHRQGDEGGYADDGSTHRIRRATALPVTHISGPVGPRSDGRWPPGCHSLGQARSRSAAHRGDRGDHVLLANEPRLCVTDRCPDNYRRTVICDLHFPWSAQRSVASRQLLPRSGGDQRPPARRPVERRGCRCRQPEWLKRSAPSWSKVACSP